MLGFDPFAFTLFSVTACCALGALLLELWGWLDRKVLFKGYKNLSLLMSIGYVIILLFTIIGMVSLPEFLIHHRAFL